jgi:hypothetical protein
MLLRPKRINGGIVIAAHDQALNMHYHQRIIMKQLIDSKCRILCNAEEHKKHIVAGCTTFALSKYTNRHSKVAVYNTGRYVNTWGCRLLTGTVKIYLRRS